MTQGIQTALQPGAGHVAAAVHQRVDDILGSVLALRIQRREEHFAPRSDEGIFADASHHHQRRQQRKHRRQRQPEKAQTHQQGHHREQHAHAQALGDPPGDEQLGDQRAGLHDQVDQREHPHLAGALRKQRAHQAGLLEIQEGGGGRQQHHEQCDARQVTGAQQQGQATEGIAGNRPPTALGRWRAGTPGAVPLAPAHQIVLAAQRQRQQQGGQHQQPGGAQAPHQQRAQHGAEQATDTGTGGDEGEQPLGLLPVEDIRHQAPGHGDHEQVVDRDPHEEGARQPDVVGLHGEQQREARQMRGEEAVYPIEVAHPWHTGAQPGEQGYGHQHAQEGGGEQPLQVLDPALDAHGLAQRPQHEVAREQAQEQREADQRRRQLGPSRVDQPRQPLDRLPTVRRRPRRSAHAASHPAGARARRAGCRPCSAGWRWPGSPQSPPAARG